MRQYDDSALLSAAADAAAAIHPVESTTLSTITTTNTTTVKCAKAPELLANEENNSLCKLYLFITQMTSAPPERMRFTRHLRTSTDK